MQMSQSNLELLDETLKKAFYQLNYADSVDDLLSERKLNFLLLEAIGQQELESLESLAKDAKNSLTSLRADANELGLSNSVEFIDSLLEEIPDTPDLVSVAIEGDPKEAAKRIGQIASATKKANAFRDSYTKAVSLFGDNLGKLDLSDDVDQNSTLKDLADAGTEGFPGIDKLETGAKAAYEPPPEQKGVFKKIASFFGFGADLTKDQFAEDILGTSYSEIVSKAQDFKTAATEAASDEEETDAATDDLEDEVEALGGGDGSALDMPTGEGGGEPAGGASDAEIEAAASEVASEVGSSVSKAELTNLLKKYPEITGQGPKATRQRRIFRKAINKIAGKEVFEEAAKYEYTEEEMIVYKLNRLAGLD